MKIKLQNLKQQIQKNKIRRGALCAPCFSKGIHNTEYGITLVALIITIIILLVLATVCIRLVMNGGIIDKAEKGTENMRGAQVEEVVGLWKKELEMAKQTAGLTESKTTEQIVNELVEKGLLKEEEKDIILGNSTKNIEAQYVITIGNKTIDFYTAEYRDGTPGLYATKTNTLLKTWDELINEGYITVSDNVITACQKNKKGDLVIAEGITEIGNRAFYSDKKLTGLTLPRSLKKFVVMHLENVQKFQK